MKKMYLACAIAIALFVGVTVSMETPSAIASETNALVNAPVLIEPALRIDLDASKEVPEGYRRVSVHNNTDAKARELWLRAAGTMEGYSFEKANQITFIARNGTGPCACHLPGACYKYDGTKSGGDSCNENCGVGVCTP
jgi:hypothetical protein